MEHITFRMPPSGAEDQTGDLTEKYTRAGFINFLYSYFIPFGYQDLFRASFYILDKPESAKRTYQEVYIFRRPILNLAKRRENSKSRISMAIKVVTCLQCKHTWATTEIPKSCPKCHSKDWNKHTGNTLITL